LRPRPALGWLLVWLALWALAPARVHAQVGGVDAPQQQGGGGAGVSIDVVGLLRWLGQTLQANQEDALYEPLQLAMVWDVGATLDEPALLALVGPAQVQREVLDELGLELRVVAYAQTSERDAALQRLQNWPGRPQGWVVDKMARLRAEESRVNPIAPKGLPGAQRPVPLGRLYAHAQVGYSKPQRLARPVKVGVVDGPLKVDLAQGAVSVVQKHFVDLPDAEQGWLHGSAVSAILAHRTLQTGDQQWFGMAQGVALWQANVLQPERSGAGAGHTALFARAVNWLLGQGVELVNCSLGGVGDEVLRRVVQRLDARGVWLVAAAGNAKAGVQAPLAYPAAYAAQWPHVIAVGAADVREQAVPGAPQGAAMGLLAPGVEVWSPVQGGRYLSGASFASPVVTAALAWALAQRSSDNEPIDWCAWGHKPARSGRDPVSGCGLLRWPDVSGQIQ